MLVDIKDAELLKTRKLLGLILMQLNEGNRVRFYTSRGRGGPTVQCLRVMLSRVRRSMEAKGKPYQRFTLLSDVFPWTLTDGTRRDCVILTRNRGLTHDLMETLEDLLRNGHAA